MSEYSFKTNDSEPSRWKFYFNEKLKKYFNLNINYLNYNVSFNKNFRKSKNKGE